MEELNLKDLIENKILNIEVNRIEDKKSKQYTYQEGQLNALKYCLKLLVQAKGGE